MAVGSARSPVLKLGGVLALALGGLTGVLFISFPDPVSAANVSINQCNGVSNTGGLTVTCEVTIVNNQTGDPATTNSVVILNGVSSSSTDLVTSVTQCNGSDNGGGGTLQCNVQITNNISVNGSSAPTAATVNQCNANQANDGLGNAPNTCDPYPATTTAATITQCNGSGNGGGLVSPSHCNASGTASSTLPVTVNQCNGSANGGGSKVNCATSIKTNIVTAGSGSTTATPGGGSTTATPGGGSTTATPGGGSTTTTPGGGSTTTIPGGVARFTG